MIGLICFVRDAMYVLDKLYILYLFIITPKQH